jgi:hypothetical protein
MGSLCEYGAGKVEGYLSDRNAESSEWFNNIQLNDFCIQRDKKSAVKAPHYEVLPRF